MSGPKSSFRAKAPQVFCHAEQSGVFTRGCSDATRRSCSQDGPHHPLAASGRILCPPAGCLIGLSFVKSFGFILVPFYGLQGQSYHASVPKARTLKHQMSKNSEKLLQIQFRKAGLGPVTRTEEGAGLSSLSFLCLPFVAAVGHKWNKGRELSTLRRSWSTNTGKARRAQPQMLRIGQPSDSYNKKGCCHPQVTASLSYLVQRPDRDPPRTPRALFFLLFRGRSSCAFRRRGAGGRMVL